MENIKKITLEIKESVYDGIKEETKKELKKDRRFFNPAFISQLIAYAIFGGIIFLMSAVNNKPSNYLQGNDMCDYMLTTEQGVEYFRSNSNPTIEEFKEILGNKKVLYMRQLSCDLER